VTNFAEKVKQELLPLKTIDSLGLGETHGRYVKPAPRYEHVVLPDGIRGNVANYGERVYESPIKTSAGRPHFSGWANDPDAFPENYFGHTRIEDMSGSDSGTKMLFGPKQGVRRVIEVQSDLYQKGNLEREALKLGDKSGIDLQEFLKAYNERNGTKYTLQNVDIKEIEKVGTGWAEPRNSALISDLEKAKDFPKLQQYNNPTAHFRMVREEIKQAAKDGKTKLQFPTGETAMKIERLGQSENNWKLLYDDIETPSGKRPSGGRKLKIEDLEIGQRISDAPNTAIYSPDNDWIITDVLGDGKFKAVPKEYWDNLITAQTHPNDYVRSLGEAQQTVERTKETFDISSKIDTSSPIYKFYEKDLGRYLMNNYKAKIVTDAQGVNWFEIDVNKDWAKLPIQAFGVAPFMFGPDILKKAKEMGYVNADEGELQAIDDEEKVRKNELPSNEEIKRQIAFRESGTVKDPYSAKNDKNSNGQIDYGKYQISNDKIKENSKRFLGKEVTSDEFLNSPELQEEFMDKMIEHLRRLGIKKFDTLLALHRKGFSDISAARIKRLKRNADVIKYLNNKPNAN
jgi:hypothetical protein